MSIIKVAGAALVVVLGATSFAIAGTDTFSAPDVFNAPAVQTQNTTAPRLIEGRTVYVAPARIGQPLPNSQNGADNAPAH